ncbi:hypothetical protein IH979_02220 [Patescibacteria group bacterium]|nr:hypothetical protein [Patescibacteria group bacterium]
MTEVLDFTWLLALFWFPIYWIIGSVVFAIVTIIRVIKLRKARFSCLFTTLSGGAAYGAAYVGLRLGEEEIAGCFMEVEDFWGSLASIFACGVFSVFLAAGVGFLLLIIAGFILLYISRARNQSWVDSD